MKTLLKISSLITAIGLGVFVPSLINLIDKYPSGRIPNSEIGLLHICLFGIITFGIGTAISIVIYAKIKQKESLETLKETKKNYCDNCKINVDASAENCPICGKELHK